MLIRNFHMIDNAEKHKPIFLQIISKTTHFQDMCLKIE